MTEELYTEFLDWLRARNRRVVLRLEDGTVLAEGYEPRSEWDNEDVEVRCRTRGLYSLGLLRRWHGGAVDEFLRERA